MKRILVIFVILVSFGIVQAQEVIKEVIRIGPTKGTVTASLVLGNSSTYSNNGWLALPSANQSTYSIVSPSLSQNPTQNSLVNMIGIEGKYFLTNTLALRLNGSTVFDATPGYEGVPAVTLNDAVILPGYNDIPARANAEVIINAGVDKYFATKNAHLFWYAGPVLNFHYGRKTGFEVTGSTADTNVDVSTTSTRYAEAYGFGISGVAGAEYYTTSGIVFGLELRGISYMYTVNSILPVEGLKTLRSDNHNISFLSLPTIKIGFRF